MGCGASINSVRKQEVDHRPPSRTTQKNESVESAYLETPIAGDSSKGLNYAESGPCADEGKPNNRTVLEKMDVEKRFPDMANAISSYKKTQGVSSENHWKTMQQLNSARASHSLSVEERDQLGEYCVTRGLHETIVRDFKEIQTIFTSSPSNVFNTKCWQSTYYLFLATLNYTDGMRLLSKGLVDKGVVQILIFFIKTVDLKGKGTDSRENYVVKVCAEIMVNLSRGVPAQVLNDNGVVDALIPIVHSEDKSIAVASLIALAAIVDEEQNNLLMTNPEPIKLIIDMLEKSLCFESHRLEEGTQWSAIELGDGLSQIAVNDKNKIEIVKQGGLKVLRKFLIKAKDTIEEASAAMCFWMLAFNEENVKKIKEFPDCIERLRTLKTSSDSKVSSHASGALWEIEQKAKRGEDIKASQSNLKQSADVDDDNLPHVMISYQWDVQKTLIKVKNCLQQNGYRVWMDVDQMQGSTLEAMAKAVENSAIVLVCISSKYKESPNCRSEAEYAFQLKKDIIPLMVERNFKPDGWLGMIVGAKLWYDFAETFRVQETVDKLMKELKTRAPQAIVGAKSFSATEEPSFSAVQSSSATSAVSKWKKVDVTSWVKEIGLNWTNIHMFQAQNFDGNLLIELWKLKQECPTVYYSSLEKDLGIVTLGDILRFNRALSAIMTN